VGEVRWTAEAAHWLHEIHEYIAQDNPEAALRTVRAASTSSLRVS
jgi:toxin ParE1/3/4